MSPDRLIVMKFGGTSVGDAARFRQCAGIVAKAAQQDRVVVVVSAMAGVTDLIFRTIEAARHGDTGSAEAGLEKFCAIHQEMIRALFTGLQLAAVEEFSDGVCRQLRKSAQALLTLHAEISPQAMDSLVALGERISSRALAEYLQQTGTASEFVRAEDVIVTDAVFGNASPDIEATRARCRSVLLPVVERGAIPVV